MELLEIAALLLVLLVALLAGAVPAAISGLVDNAVIGGNPAATALAAYINDGPPPM